MKNIKPFLLSIALILPNISFAFCSYQHSNTNYKSSRVTGTGFDTYWHTEHTQCWNSEVLRNVIVNVGTKKGDQLSVYPLYQFYVSDVDKHGWISVQITAEEKSTTWNVSIINYFANGSIKSKISAACVGDVGRKTVCSAI